MTSASSATPAAIRLAPFDAAIFDMDGTLLDTEAVFRDIVFDVCTELGFEMTHDVHRSMVGSSHERTNQLLIEAYGVAFPYSLFDEKCRVIMRERSHGGVPVKAGAREFILELRARGIPTAVATSSRNPHAEHHLRAAGLFELSDGRLELSLRVADTLEVRRFILGYGAQAEVVEPPSLREALRAEIAAAAELLTPRRMPPAAVTPSTGPRRNVRKAGVTPTR